jgi:hypothetical protein
MDDPNMGNILSPSCVATHSPNLIITIVEGHLNNTTSNLEDVIGLTITKVVLVC